MRVVMLGQRGLPASWGGVERHVEEVGARLVDGGADVTVYCRASYSSANVRTYRGMRIRHSAGIATKHLDALTHTSSALLSCLRGGYDVIHFHGLGPACLAPLARVLTSAKVVTTVHGLDHERAKWGRFGRRAFEIGANLAIRNSDGIIVVSRDLAGAVRRRGREAVYIPNGMREPVTPTGAGRILDTLHLRSVPFILTVGRLVPEKGHLDLVRAFAAVDDPGLKLVIAGGSSAAVDYERVLRQAADKDPRVVLAGNVFADDLATLYAAADLFVQPSHTEGMPLTVLEALAHNAPMVLSDIPVHEETVGSEYMRHAGFRSGDSHDLTRALRAALATGSQLRTLVSAVAATARDLYSWDQVAAATADYYEQIVGTRSRANRPA